ncbi:MAG TPA: PEPxxWA-CTERM sorting domain-containing protein [Sphingomicrobium sp.]|nr:PEPxxWA-CTERM sorting domain-containing protein [Sphingomicrobium sp.]
MIRKISRYIACTVAAAACIAVATPASAQTTINLTGSSATDGTDGNIRSFTSGGITVQASAWSYDGATLETAWLGAYSSGLGVTNNNEGNGSSSSTHTIDNLGQRDFVLLVFNQLVNVSSANLNPFNISSTADDNDALVSFATLAGAFTSPTPTAVSLASPVWASLMGVDYNVAGNMSSPYLTSLASAGSYGNVWLIGGASPNLDANDDGFKLRAITVTTAVPEPATWAMMLVGFGLAGASLRRRNRRPAPCLA